MGITDVLFFGVFATAVADVWQRWRATYCGQPATGGGSLYHDYQEKCRDTL